MTLHMTHDIKDDMPINTSTDYRLLLLPRATFVFLKMIIGHANSQKTISVYENNVPSNRLSALSIHNVQNLEKIVTVTNIE